MANPSPDDWLPFLFSLEGRSSLGDAWRFYTLPCAALSALLWAAGKLLGAPWLLDALSLLSAWPGLALAVRRCHDRDRSGWFLLLLAVPVLGLWVLAETCFLPGTQGPNRFGADPSGR